MKSKLSNKDIYALGGIILMSAMIMIICIARGKLYGSEVDWISQHFAIPEYFRQLFYDTHQLFPSYAANLGAGENIYALSYYGLFSPPVMLSYLLPFVPMGYYYMFVGVITVFAGDAIFYFFFRKTYNTRVTAFVTSLFAFSMPFLFHSHRHIMFITFMPFLLLAMHYTDVYYEKGRRLPLVICAFLMIMCNYFFAVCSLVALAAYGFVKACSGSKHIKDIVKKYFPVLCMLFISVLMACVLLLPTAYCLLSGRDEGNVKISLLSFLPTLHLDWLTYCAYPMGLTGFSVYAIIYSIFHAKGIKRLTAVMILLLAVCPVFVFILNGTLYFDAKVLFAFLPLALTVVADVIDDIFQNGAHKMLYPLPAFVVASVISLIVAGPSISMYMYILDMAVTSGLILMLRKRHDLKICCSFVVIALIGCVARNLSDKFVSVNQYEHLNSFTIEELVSDASSGQTVRTAVDVSRVDTPNKVYGINHYQDTVYSSIHSKLYNNFFFEEMYNENEYRNSALTTRSQNALFNCYMGDKYYISDKPVHFYGFELIKQTEDGFFMYENKNAYPLIYHTNKLMSKKEYDKLEYPASVEALMKYSVVDDDIADTGFKTSYEKTDIGDMFDIGDILKKEDTCTLDKNGVRHIFLYKRRFEYRFETPESLRGRNILLKFNVDNNFEIKKINNINKKDDRDVFVTINGIKNKLTDPDWKYYNGNKSFEYVLTDISKYLDIVIKGGELNISGIEAYLIPDEDIDTLTDSFTAFEFDNNKTKGDVIAGTIDAPTDGYIATSFVYNDGFTILCDGKEIEPKVTDTAFLGFYITKGKHDITITYKAPWLNVGMAASGLGFAGLIVIILLDINTIRKSKKNKT